MPNRRSKRGRTKKFFCPICEQQLWRNGREKYPLFYQDAAAVRRNTGMSAKKAKLYLAKCKTYLDTKTWVEKLYCEHHGDIWLTISERDGKHQYRSTNPRDWQQTVRTIDPSRSNPSVSDYTMRMSRKLRIRASSF